MVFEGHVAKKRHLMAKPCLINVVGRMGSPGAWMIRVGAHHFYVHGRVEALCRGLRFGMRAQPEAAWEGGLGAALLGGDRGHREAAPRELIHCIPRGASRPSAGP